MEFKFIILSVACLAFLAQPAQSGDISGLATKAANTVREIVSFVPNIAKAKGEAAAQVAADFASIFTTGLGLKLRALGKAGSTIKGAVADGLISIGDSFSKAGSVSSNTRVIEVRTPVVQKVVEQIDIAPVVVEEDIVVPCEQDVVEIPVESYPIRSMQVKVLPPVVEPAARVSFVANNVPSVWNTLKKAADARVNEQMVRIESAHHARPSVVYEIVDTPRVFQGPLIETFQIEKK